MTKVMKLMAKIHFHQCFRTKDKMLVTIIELNCCTDGKLCVFCFT